MSHATQNSADAISTDMFSSRFLPLLTEGKCSELGDIINIRLRAEGRNYRYTVLQPGSSTGDELALLKKFLGREPDVDFFSFNCLGQQLSPGISNWGDIKTHYSNAHCLVG